MASRGSHSDVTETNLDKVEVDEDGNLRQKSGSSPEKSLSRDTDVAETNLDEVEVDVEGNLRQRNSSSHRKEDESNLYLDSQGNLRIRSTGILYHDPTNRHGDSDATDEDAYLSAREHQSLQRRQAEKHRYSGEGTPEEEKEMSFVSDNHRRTELAMPLSARKAQRDPEDIELTVFRFPHSREDSAADSPPLAASVQSVERGERQEPREERELSRFERVVDRVGGYFKNLSAPRLAVLVAVIVAVVAILLTVGLLIPSFVYVEYYELALAKSRLTGKINRDDVYYPGCHLLTPDTELIRFKGTAHFLVLSFDAYTSDKLTFDLDISLQYFIKPQELGLLFTNYYFDYEEVIETIVRTALKNEAVKYSLDNYRLNRSMVEEDFRSSVSYRLSGDCCPDCCPRRCGGRVNCQACRLAGRGCYRGFHMELRYFQLRGISVPSQVAERFVRQTLLAVEAEKEVFVQEHAVQTKISQMMRDDILNKAAEVREAASAEARKIQAEAEADYEKLVQLSFVEALKKFYRRLNVTREDHKLSLMYIRSLEDISDNLYNLNFDKVTSFN